MTLTHWATWGIVAAATAGVITRPFSWPEWIWAVSGAALLVLLGLLSPTAALSGVSEGTEVYLFLAGMMVLSELARQEKLFDWLATHAARAARGSGFRLFTLIYGVSTLVTVFLSNDATAVVLTPAVAAAARAAKARDPLPHLYACAFVANAASFVLPISNPANLVIYGSQMPPLLEWLPRFALPSLLSIGVTFVILCVTQRTALRKPVSGAIDPLPLSPGGRMAAFGIAATAALLLTASALSWPLGPPTFLAAAITASITIQRSAARWRNLLRGVAWGVLPLVAGLFVLVKALDATGVTAVLSRLLQGFALESIAEATWFAGIALGLGSNLVNNLPAGLLAGNALRGCQESSACSGRCPGWMV